MILNYINFLAHIIFYVAPGNFAPLHNALFLKDCCNFVSSISFQGSTLVPVGVKTVSRLVFGKRPARLSAAFADISTKINVILLTL